MFVEDVLPHFSFPILTGLPEWDHMGGTVSLTFDEANRSFTMVCAQSNQDRILDILTQQRRVKQNAK